VSKRDTQSTVEALHSIIIDLHCWPNGLLRVGQGFNLDVSLAQQWVDEKSTV
jgi:hypothetical protein